MAYSALCFDISVNILGLLVLEKNGPIQKQNAYQLIVITQASSGFNYTNPVLLYHILKFCVTKCSLECGG
jgi:hypothetical protein